MADTKEEFKKGLEDVVAGDSKICKVDGEKGRLWYRGYTIEDLAANCSFEEVTYLLLYEKLPTQKELSDFSAKLAGQRELPERIMALIRTFDKKMNSMEAMRTAVSALGDGEPDARFAKMDVHMAAALSMAAKFPTIAAYQYRLRNRMELVHPDKSLSHAANFLYMITGKKPSEVETRAMDTDFVLHVEHSFNASTFAARVTVSTLSDMYSAMTTGLGVLKGPLHGGAAEAVFAMLKQIGDAKNVDAYITRALANHEKIMGIGHRIYKTHDPRAAILKKMAKELSKQKKDMKWFEICDAIEKKMIKEKNLYPNVDFYSSIVYHSLGMPNDMDTAIFAIARISGWSAHALEQYSDNRLIRPIDNYIGPMNLKFVPIKDRK
jgi:citrate synthase